MPRPKETGTVYYLGRIRYKPGLHDERLKQFLGYFSGASQAEKLTILQDLLAGGGFEQLKQSTGEEDAETSALLEELL